MEEKIIQLAALLHDVGKFWQGAGGEGRHQELSKRFVEEILQLPDNIDEKLLSTLVLRHHDRSDLAMDLRVSGLQEYSTERRLAKVISEADNISSAMDREYDEESEVRQPLIPIFPQIHEEKNTNKKDYYYLPLELSLDNIRDPLQEGSYNTNHVNKLHSELWNQLCNEVKEISTSDPEVWIHNLYYLLQNYTTFVLTAGYKTKPDIPLFDHLKTTAAIADCLYKFTTEENTPVIEHLGESKPYLLIEGDLSGIQNFIFQVASPEEARKGMSKRLRGRSFWLTLLMDAVATKIIDELGLPETNILWNTGGHFLIIAPNLDRNEEIIVLLRESLNKRLFVEYGGKLFIAISALECSEKDVKNFGATKEGLTHKTNMLKRQKFREVISNDPKFFEPKPEGKNTSIESHCVVCGAYNRDIMWFKDDEGKWKRWNNEDATIFCELCKNHEDLGKELAKADYLVRVSDLPEELETRYELQEKGFALFDCLYFLLGENELEIYLKILEDVRVYSYKLNDVNFWDNELSKKYPDVFFGFKFIGKTIPTDKAKNVLPFEHLAQMSKGADKLGVLKADVDNLGKIFAIGLEKEVKSMSRVHTLSSMLEMFFAGYLNKICERYYVFYELCDGCKDKAKEIEIKGDTGEIEHIYYEIDENDVCDDCNSNNNKVYKPYITYSGGDDLLIIGPWDTIIELAQDIRTEFKKITCENPNISISAGIAVVDPHYPVARTVMLADENLEEAKNEDIRKDRISLFNEVVRWDSTGSVEKDFGTIFSLAKTLEEMSNGKVISKSFIYSLLRMWRDTFADLDSLPKEKRIKARSERKRYMPLLKYQLVRNVKDEAKREEIGMKIARTMAWIRIPVSWVSLRTR
jgi:CRISPR-associated protein Csm1